MHGSFTYKLAKLNVRIFQWGKLLQSAHLLIEKED